MRSTPDSTQAPTLRPAQIQTRRPSPRLTRPNPAAGPARFALPRRPLLEFLPSRILQGLLPAAVLCFAQGLAPPAAAQPAGMTKAQAEEAIRAWVTGDPLQEALKKKGIAGIKVEKRMRVFPMIGEETARLRLKAIEPFPEHPQRRMLLGALEAHREQGIWGGPHELVWANDYLFCYGSNYKEMSHAEPIAIYNNVHWRISFEDERITHYFLFKENVPHPPGYALYTFASTVRGDVRAMCGLDRLLPGPEASVLINFAGSAWTAVVSYTEASLTRSYTGEWMSLPDGSNAPIVTSLQVTTDNPGFHTLEYYFAQHEYNPDLGIPLAMENSRNPFQERMEQTQILSVTPVTMKEIDEVAAPPDPANYDNVYDFRTTDSPSWTLFESSRNVAEVWTRVNPGEPPTSVPNTGRLATAVEINRIGKSGPSFPWAWVGVTAAVLAVGATIVLRRHGSTS